MDTDNSYIFFYLQGSTKHFDYEVLHNNQLGLILLSSTEYSYYLCTVLPGVTIGHTGHLPGGPGLPGRMS